MYMLRWSVMLTPTAFLHNRYFSNVFYPVVCERCCLCYRLSDMGSALKDAVQAQVISPMWAKMSYIQAAACFGLGMEPSCTKRRFDYWSKKECIFFQVVINQWSLVKSLHVVVPKNLIRKFEAYLWKVTCVRLTSWTFHVRSLAFIPQRMNKVPTSSSTERLSLSCLIQLTFLATNSVLQIWRIYNRGSTTPTTPVRFD